MVTNDGTIIQIKHDILCEVAKLVFAGKFETEKDELPYRMMPGPKAKYRCCVYKEREIVRQRIRLAEGKAPQGSHNDLVVQVVQAACPATLSQTTARSAWGKPVSSPVISEQSILAVRGHILTRRNVGNAASVRQHVPTTPLQT